MVRIFMRVIEIAREGLRKDILGSIKKRKRCLCFQFLPSLF